MSLRDDYLELRKRVQDYLDMDDAGGFLGDQLRQLRTMLAKEVPPDPVLQLMTDEIDAVGQLAEAHKQRDAAIEAADEARLKYITVLERYVKVLEHHHRYDL